MLGWFVGNGIGHAQTPEVEKVRLSTCDGVTLRAVYYPGKGRDACPVLLLHELGDSQANRALKAFAVALQKKGHAVLTFDFRGHGDSTEVEANQFWSNSFSNRSLVRGYPACEIAFKSFDSRYYPVLVNDIAAAKAYLDRRNDDGECDASNLVVIGFERGATLGALWVNSEFSRYELLPASFGNPLPHVSNSAEGNKILCALWFSIEPKLGSRTVPLPSLVYAAGKNGNLPMVFLHGEKDLSGKRRAEQCEKTLGSLRKASFTGTTAVPDAGDGRGTDLLDRAETVQAILQYIDDVHEEKAGERAEQDFRKKQFIWRLPAGFLSANRLGDTLLSFNTYEAFLPRR